MTDYTKVFDGAAKDAANSAVLGSDHDTEFSAISVAVNTKMDKVVAGTTGALVEMSASGNAVDSGIDSANLDGLTSNVQTQLDALVPNAAVTDHAVAFNTQIIDGSVANASGQGLTSVTKVTWKTYGPTGSGADIIDAMMDDVPSTARILIFMAQVSVWASGTSEASIYAHVAEEGITPVVDAGTQVVRAAITGAANDKSYYTTQIMVPCNASQVFQFYWNNANTTSASCNFFYQGFIDGLG